MMIQPVAPAADPRQQLYPAPPTPPVPVKSGLLVALIGQLATLIDMASA